MPTSTLLDSSRLRHSRDALAHSVSGSTWRRAFDIRSADATVAISARVGLAAAVVLLVFGVTGHGGLAGFAVLGSLSAAFSRYEPLRRTAQKVGSVGLLVVASVLAGGLIGLSGLPMWGQIGLMAVVSGVGAAMLLAFRIGGPGPVVLVFAGTAAVGTTVDVGDLGSAVLVTAIGAAVGFVTALLPFAFLPWGPARLAVARALAAVAAVRGGADAGAAHGAIAAAREKLALTSSSADHDHLRDLSAVLGEAEVALNDWESGDATRLDEVIRHEAELRKVKRHRIILGTDVAMPTLPRPAAFGAAGVAGLRTRAVAVYAARVLLASAVAGWFAAALGFDHPLWASMGAMAAIQGLTYRQTVQRGIQRLLGNIGGALIAAVLIALSLGYWQAVVVIVILQTCAELAAARNYALCTLFVTPMALVVVGLGAAVEPGVGVSRVLDTLVGVVVGVVVAAVTISRADREHVPGAVG